MTLSLLEGLPSPVVFGGKLNTQREIWLMPARVPSMALLVRASLSMAWSMPPELEDSACDADAEPAKEERAGGGGRRTVKGKNSF